MNGTLTNTGPLLKFMMRLDRIKGSIWLYGTIIFVPYVLFAYNTVFKDPAQLQSILGMMANPTMAIFTGPGYGINAETANDPNAIELVFAGIYWGYLLIIVGLLNMFLITRHTRVEEQSGRAELLRADVVGSNAPLTAALVWALINNVVLAIGISVAFMAFGSDATSSWLIGTATGTFGLFFAALTAVIAQMTTFSSAASGITGAILGVSFIVRGLGDMMAPAGEHGTWLSWLSPFGWAQQTRAFYDDRWWPALIPLAGAVLLVFVAFALQARRDIGSGLWASKTGRTSARAWLASIPMAVFAIQRGRIFWWAFGMALTALMYGSFTPAMVEAFGTLPPVIANLMGGAGGAVSGYVTLSITMYQIMLGVMAVMLIGNVVNEEREGRLEPVLATSTTPARWLTWNWIWVVLAVGVLAAVLGLVAGAFGQASDASGDWVVDGTLGGLVGVPGVLIVLGVAVALYGLLPRWFSLAWIPVVYGGITQMFGTLLNLPDWALQLSPFHATPQYPADPIEATPLIVQSVVGLALFAAGLFGIGRRNIPTA